MAKKTNNAAAKRRPAKKKAEAEPVVVQQERHEPPVVDRGEDGIDIVVPMVFPNGAEWLRTYRETCSRLGVTPTINERYRSWDLERYFFRGIAKNMPFVRKIHLILSDEGQIPFWLNRDRNVHIVLHKDIIPADLLPTFNSSTIEMWLHNIEGLSETFIYCNDDMIATAPMEATDFFIDGKPVTRCSEKHVEIIGSFLKTVRNSQNLAAGDYGKTFDDNVLLRDGHSYAPFLLSVLKETAEKHGDAMRDSCTTFRSDNNMCQYLYTYEQWFGGKCVNGYHTHRYFSLDSDYDKMSAMLLSGTAGVACFNDGGIGDWREMRVALFNVLQKILGEKCKYEV